MAPDKDDSGAGRDGCYGSVHQAMLVTVDAAGWPSAVVAAWCGGVATNDAHGARIAIDGMYVYPGYWIIRGAS